MAVARKQLVLPHGSAFVDKSTLQLPRPAMPVGEVGMQVSLVTNLVKLRVPERGEVHMYSLTMEPELRSTSLRRAVLALAIAEQPELAQVAFDQRSTLYSTRPLRCVPFSTTVIDPRVHLEARSEEDRERLLALPGWLQRKSVRVRVSPMDGALSFSVVPRFLAGVGQEPSQLLVALTSFFLTAAQAARTFIAPGGHIEKQRETLYHAAGNAVYLSKGCIAVHGTELSSRFGFEGLQLVVRPVRAVFVAPMPVVEYFSQFPQEYQHWKQIHDKTRASKSLLQKTMVDGSAAQEDKEGCIHSLAQQYATQEERQNRYIATHFPTSRAAGALSTSTTSETSAVRSTSSSFASTSASTSSSATGTVAQSQQQPQRGGGISGGGAGRGKRASNQITFADAVVGLRVVTTHKAVQEYVVTGLALPATEHIIKIGKTKFVTLAQFYKEKFSVELARPDLPCLQAGKHAVLPMELCTILSGQFANGPLQSQDRAVLQAFGRMPSGQHRGLVETVLQTFGQSRLLRNAGIGVSSALTSVSARWVPPFQIYTADQDEPPISHNGSWVWSRKKLMRPVSPRNVFIVAHSMFMSGPYQEALRQFLAKWRAVSLDMGYPMLMHDPTPIRFHDIAELEAALMGSSVRRGDLVLGVCSSYSNDMVYATTKRVCSGLLGIASQFININTVTEVALHPWPVFVNLTLKVNLKLGGVNYQCPPVAALATPTLVLGLDCDHPCRVGSHPANVGKQAVLQTSQQGDGAIESSTRQRSKDADSTSHATAAAASTTSSSQSSSSAESIFVKRLYDFTHPSHSCVIGSRDLDAVTFCGVVQQQGVNEEVVPFELMERAIRRHILRFQESTGALPEHIVMIRDSLDEQLWPKVYDEEIKAMRAAARKAGASVTAASLSAGGAGATISSASSTSEAGAGATKYAPKLLVVLCVKRHPRRFWPADNIPSETASSASSASTSLSMLESASASTSSVGLTAQSPAMGTVIDASIVTKPTVPEFYMYAVRSYQIHFQGKTYDVVVVVVGCHCGCQCFCFHVVLDSHIPPPLPLPPPPFTPTSFSFFCYLLCVN